MRPNPIPVVAAAVAALSSSQTPNRPLPNTPLLSSKSKNEVDTMKYVARWIQQKATSDKKPVREEEIRNLISSLQAGQSYSRETRALILQRAIIKISNNPPLSLSDKEKQTLEEINLDPEMAILIMKQMESADIIKLLQFIYKNYEKDSFKLNNELLLAMVRKDGMLLGAIMQMGFANNDTSESLEGEAIAQNPLAMIFVDENNFEKYLPLMFYYPLTNLLDQIKQCRTCLEDHENEISATFITKRLQPDFEPEIEIKNSTMSCYFLIPKEIKFSDLNLSQGYPIPIKTSFGPITKIKEKLTVIEEYIENIEKRMENNSKSLNPEVQESMNTFESIKKERTEIFKPNGHSR